MEGEEGEAVMEVEVVVEAVVEVGEGISAVAVDVEVGVGGTWAEAVVEVEEVGEVGIWAVAVAVVEGTSAGEVVGSTLAAAAVVVKGKVQSRRAPSSSSSRGIACEHGRGHMVQQ